MAKGYKNIFLGIFLATFNIKIGVIKILPAFIAWTIALTGIKNIRKENDNVYFEKAYKYNFVLIILSLIGSLLNIAGILDGFAGLSVTIHFIFEFLMILKIIEGTMDYSKQINKEELYLEFEAKKKAYMILQTIVIVGFFIASVMNNEAMILLFGFTGIIVRIYVMMMMNRLGKITMEINN